MENRQHHHKASSTGYMSGQGLHIYMESWVELVLNGCLIGFTTYFETYIYIYIYIYQRLILTLNCSFRWCLGSLSLYPIHPLFDLFKLYCYLSCHPALKKKKIRTSTKAFSACRSVYNNLQLFESEVSNDDDEKAEECVNISKRRTVSRGHIHRTSWDHRVHRSTTQRKGRVFIF